MADTTQQQWTGSIVNNDIMAEVHFMDNCIWLDSVSFFQCPDISMCHHWRRKTLFQFQTHKQPETAIQCVNIDVFTK